MTVLLIKGRTKWNTGSAVLRKLARLNFVVYIFHPLVIVGLTLALRNWEVDPALKLLLAAPIVLGASYGLGGLILRIPGVKKVL